jgi:hypothetical protein
MFEEIVNIIGQSIKNTDSRNYLEISGDIRNYLLPTLPLKVLQNIICDTTNQKKMNFVNRICYSYNNEIQNFVQHENMTHNDISLSPIIIEYYENMTFIEFICLDELINYLNINKNCDYVALPILYGNHEEGQKELSGHISVLIFDNINNLVYHIDSNGWNTSEKSLKFEKFISQNIEMLNDISKNFNNNLSYNYIETDLWNEEKIYLNINYNHQELNDKGNCMIWTLLIIKMLQETKQFPGEIFDKLEKLEYEEKVFTIKTYGDLLLNIYARDKVYKMTNQNITLKLQ